MSDHPPIDLINKVSDAIQIAMERGAEEYPLIAKAAIAAMGDFSIEPSLSNEVGRGQDSPKVESPANSCEIRVVDEDFVVEHIWRLFDQFQSPTIGNRSPKAEESAKIMAKRVFDKLSPYLRQPVPVMSEEDRHPIPEGTKVPLAAAAIAIQEWTCGEYGLKTAMRAIEAYEAAKSDQPIGLSLKIYQILNNHKLIHQKIRFTDAHLPLVDYLTPEGESTISLGMEENEAIAEAIAEALCKN